MKKLLLALLLFMLLYPPNPSFALSCAEFPTVEKAYESYSGVVLGYVEDVNRARDHNEIKITVTHSFKEIDARTLILDENITWGSMNGPSEVGEEYLFFLNKKGNGWENPLCSPSKKAINASSELAFLQNKEIPLQIQPTALSDSASKNWIAPVVIGALVGIVALGMLRYVKRKKK